ncbi:hypothetical protein Hanom_Chr14g01308121 [Helianthus anomalus]
MRKSKPLDESRKSGQTSGTKMAFYSKITIEVLTKHRKDKQGCMYLTDEL